MLSNFEEDQIGEPLQLVLGTDKRNPLVSIYLRDETQSLHVYYGLELMEVIPAERKHPSFKLLVAYLSEGLSLNLLNSKKDRHCLSQNLGNKLNASTY